MRQVAGVLGNYRQRRIIAHGAHGFLGILHHRREDQLHVFQCLASGDLAAAQNVPIIGRSRFRLGASRQILEIGEAGDQRGIILRTGHLRLDLCITVEFRRRGIQIDRDHLAGAERAFLHDVTFRHDHHPGFRTGDQQAITREAITHRPQRVAIKAGDHPAAIGHGQRRRPVPRLHQRREKRIHSARRRIEAGITLPGLRNQHQLGGRRIATRPHKGFEHRIKRRRIRRAGRDQRLDVFRMFAKRGGRHLDLVALHPVAVAADRVDFAIVRQGAERLRQPPLREGVGGIALVIDGKARNEALVVEVRIENAQRFRQEQPLVDQRTA